MLPGGILCLDPPTCVRSPTTVMIVRVSRRLAPREPAVFIARYHSCWRGYAQSVHAEEFMMGDGRLTELLRAPGRRPLQIDIYLTQQPCNFSTGRFATRKVSGKTSCTAQLIAWWQKVRAEADILQIWVANIFRAHGIDEAAAKLSEKERKIYVERAMSAQRGLDALFRAGIGVRMIDEEGWTFLGGLAGLTEGGQGFERWESLFGRRVQSSRHIDAFLIERSAEALRRVPEGHLEE